MDVPQVVVQVGVAELEAGQGGARGASRVERGHTNGDLDGRGALVVRRRIEGHAEQVEPVVAPRVPEYVPAPQSLHAAEPVAVLYFPAKQAVHATPSGPEYPVLQTQLSTLVLAVGEFVYKGHA